MRSWIGGPSVRPRIATTLLETASASAAGYRFRAGRRVDGAAVRRGRLVVDVEAARVAGRFEEDGRQGAGVSHVEGGQDGADRVIRGVVLVQAALRQQVAAEVVVDLLTRYWSRLDLP